ncbi:4Fe-4S single cluster domain-containing protein [Paenibacillus sp. sgz500992]|uniref:4Fe-4S single cluster domain-containing protein n=1 Tax=Paenibacillus sp. sgz500992 TaxID=3242476 RepID=UPI0036D41E0E
MNSRSPFNESVQDTEIQLLLHTSVTPYSLVNGPGLRLVIHLQGCTLACIGCFNPASHQPGIGIKMSIDELCKSIPNDVEGITVSGGEPFQQQDGLLLLLKKLRQHGYSIIVFSGYTQEEISKLPKGNSIMEYIDVLIDGRYEADQSADIGLRGSNNQVIHLLTDRYRMEDLQVRRTELTFLQDGTATLTGFPSGALRKIFSQIR